MLKRARTTREVRCPVTDARRERAAGHYRATAGKEDQGLVCVFLSTVEWHGQLGYAVLVRCIYKVSVQCAGTIAVSEPQSRRMSPSFRGSAGYVFWLDEEVSFAPALVPLLLFLAYCCPIFLHELQPAHRKPMLATSARSTRTSTCQTPLQLCGTC